MHLNSPILPQSIQLIVERLQISPFEFLLQMAEFSKTFWDHEGHAHTNALHWEGFPRLLWESLQLFCYTKPPQYDGVEYSEEGVPRCRVEMTIPQHPFCSLWQPIEISVVGFRIVDTIEAAALKLSTISATNSPKKLPRILLAYSLLWILVTPSGFSEYHIVAIYWEIRPKRRYVL
jgi:hypothetical protein